MKFEDNILNELQLLSPLLAELPKTNVFIIPDGYFETLSAAILLFIKEDSGIINTSKIADIPEGYFENLASTILNKIKEQEINIAANKPTMVSALLQSAQHSNQFEVPEGYFENLSSTILNKIKEGQINSAADELESLSPVLHSIKHTNVFEVPEGYFNKVPANIFHLVNATPAKVVSIPASGSYRMRSVLRYAAAAVITGAVALGVYKYTEKSAVTITVPAVSFATLDTSIEKGKAMNEQQFNDALNNLTKEDITNYLEKNGSDEDISLLTPNVDGNDLPNKDDYLLDDKTLENYLDKIKFQN